ncbi:hypothetical protein [Paenibacillus durus]|uniref:Fibronectin type-III domain-containing protein n=1 Tax=Paenibacillus durus TaxID=44251 RepID=A0A089HT88_PAEDU|nr:hypothetical protein [Paenibacillus durus]AIQ15256.1 hypothetical protein PDUR_27885 [Paenibacillus durus]
MKRCWPLLIFGLLLLFPMPVTHASDLVTINLDNYFYVHTSDTGRTYFKDKYGNTTIYGDASEHDAKIMQVSINTQGLGSGDKIYIITPSGAERLYSGDSMYLDPSVENIKIVLDKASGGETYATMARTYVNDQSNGGTFIYYMYNLSTPTQYGNLPAATPTPSAAATPTPTPNPTPTSTTTASPTPTPIYDVHPYQAGGLLVWSNPLVNTGYVAIYKDGNLLVSITENPRDTSTYPLAGNGEYTVKVVSTQGNLIGMGTLTVTDGSVGTATPTPTPSPTPTPTDPGGGTGGVDPVCTESCQNLKDMLECPEWDQYMGDLTAAIARAIPPPPDWDMVASKIGAATINDFAQWAGSVPAPPTKEEIDSETNAGLPTLDQSVETDGLVPQVPGDYNNGEIDFDLSKDAPTIEVKDESQPFTISDPLTDMPHDNPGVKVIPGDPRNSTGGFKTPDPVDTGDPEPTPVQIPNATPGTAPMPNNTAGSPPIPNATDSTVPIPGGSGGPGAIPTMTNGVIPIPGGG